VTVDLEPKGDGRAHFTLGPIERWLVAGSGLMVIAVGGWFVKSINEQQTTLQTVVTQQAVTNSQLTTISGQLLDIPAIRANQAEMKIRVDRLEQDMREQRQTRGLK